MTSVSKKSTKAEEAVVIGSHIQKSYGEGDRKVYAVRDVSVEVQKGELFMLVGPSGCGKTTLISIIAAILRPDGGKCSVLGHELTTLTEREKNNFRAKHLGFVFQSFNLIPALTIAENVAIPLIINGMARHRAVEEAKALLKEIGLASKVDASPVTLSGGQQQRVAISRALIHSPELIVCDEPTSALDGETGHRVMEIMKKMVREKGRTLIVVTHDIRIFPFADRIAMMEDGRILKVVHSYKEVLENEEQELLKKGQKK